MGALCFSTDHCAIDKCRVFATELRAVKWSPWLQVCDDGLVIALTDGNGVFGQAAVCGVEAGNESGPCFTKV
jgi:hypothetical protein